MHDSSALMGKGSPVDLQMQEGGAVFLRFASLLVILPHHVSPSESQQVEYTHFLQKRQGSGGCRQEQRGMKVKFPRHLAKGREQGMIHFELGGRRGLQALDKG